MLEGKGLTRSSNSSEDAVRTLASSCVRVEYQEGLVCFRCKVQFV